jgi:hypothetical protein
MVAGSLTGQAQADQPTKTDIVDFVSTVRVHDLCSFPINVTGTLNGFELVRDTASGSVAEYHLTEADVFTAANGTTLTGTPYHFNLKITYDAAGNEVSSYSTGVTVNVPLPGGLTFRAAGRVDWSQVTEDFVAVPTHGGSQNLDAFCAALS